MDESGRPVFEERVLFLAPTAKDAEAGRAVLGAHGVRCVVCSSLAEVCREMGRGAGAAIVPAEALLNDREGRLVGALRDQPAWSDFPLIVLTPAGAEESGALSALRAVGNMALMNCPMQLSTFVSVVQAALRDRRRQYEVRGHLAERERQAEALRQAEGRLRLMIESVRDYAIFSLDTEGRVATWNTGAERVFGWEEEEILGRDGGLLYTPEDRAAGAPQQEQAKAREVGRAEDERWHSRKDGSLFFASGVLTPIRDGHLRGYTKVCRDVTRLRQAEAALRAAHAEMERRVEERTAALEEAQRKALQAERLAAIGEMVAGLAHESRNALQRSQACLSLLELRVKGRPEELDLIRRLQQAQDDLQRLFDDVREYAAPVTLARRDCDLAEVWREAWADLAAARQGRDVQLREEGDGVSPCCLADPFRLRQVFRNVFDNSLGAIAGPVRVVVRCGADALEGRPALRLAVEDNGPGFAAEQRARLFEPFHTTKLRGTGLGLAICKRVVEAHGGRIAASEGPAGGAVILITLPRRDP